MNDIVIHRAKQFELFSLHPSQCNGTTGLNFLTVISSHHSKVTPISVLQAEKIAEAVLL